jgi:hypothetical protein
MECKNLWAVPNQNAYLYGHSIFFMLALGFFIFDDTQWVPVDELTSIKEKSHKYKNEQRSLNSVKT